MLSLLRNRLGIPGIIAVIALVFAMAGGALAAKKYVITSKGQIKPNVLKQLTGAKGPKGDTGAPGAPGAKGDTGAPGAPGAPGAKGAAGAAGPSGNPGSQGIQGPAGATGATGTNGSNGATGPTGGTGPTGFSGFTATLPSGMTETGGWAFSGAAVKKSVSPTGFAYAETAISFPIPLPASLPGSNTHLVPPGVQQGAGTGDLHGNKTVDNVTVSSGSFTVGSSIFGTGIASGTTIKKVEEPSAGVFTLEISKNATATATGESLTAGPPAGCTGGSVASPKADAGHLCVYQTAALQNAATAPLIAKLSSSVINSAGIDPVGAVIRVPSGTTEEPGYVIGWGTWAVTAP